MGTNLDALDNNASLTLGKQRLWLIYTVIALITVGSLFDIVTRTEHWPFSPYDLYSGVLRQHSLTLLRLYGVTEGEAPEEMALFAFRYIQPFDNARLRFALMGMYHDANREKLLSEALQDRLIQYEELRLADRHDSPPLQGIRLYRLYWKLDPWARNADLPDRKDLIFEIMRPSKRER